MRHVLSVFLMSLSLVAAGPARSAEWTLMVYMNGKNNLEPDAINNFYSMANVGSTQQVNVVAELGRPTHHYTNSDDGWSGVRRFLINKGTRPALADAISDPGQEGQSTDMGSPQTLSEFIEWSIARFPAKRYMLIIWNHGQGWRFQLAPDRTLRITAASRSQTAKSHELSATVGSVPPLNGYRSVSLDEDTGNILFNSDIQTVLENRFSSRKLDLIGFDACLMSMIETAYAFRKAADTMVASEELEPGEGWQYEVWLRALVDLPSLDAHRLAKAVVDSYRSHWGNSYLTTMSAIDLAQVGQVADSVSTLSRLFESRIASQAPIIRAARAKLTPYGHDAQLNTSIDLDYFLEMVGNSTTDADVLAAVRKTRQQIARMVLTNYASKRDLPLHGSRGIAFYFPASQADFLSDPYRGGYLKNNSDHPVEFVKREAWSDFLASYLKITAHADR
jgi:hypothetical protein